jgi:hypothetical protein
LDEKSKGWYERIFQWIIDSLFDRMILLDEEDNTAEFINCLATVYAFAKSCPNLLREPQISMLQPYLTISEQVKVQWKMMRDKGYLNFNRMIGLKHLMC